MTQHRCYMGGTRIRAARGEIAIEFIRPGDEVVVVRNGSERLEPVKWVGYSKVDLRNHPRVEDAAPIRIRKDAVAEFQPMRDLLVSPEHCLIIDGLCVPAKLLVNGCSIVSERVHEPFVYYHIELDRHGALLAEDLAAESYLDTGNREVFDNANLPRPLHKVFGIDPHSARWLTDACAPLAQVPDQVAPIWTRLAERAMTLGYRLPEVATIADADIHLLADGCAIRPVSDRDRRIVFTVPTGCRSVSLCSRFCIPSDRMIAGQRDTRRLGLRVNWIAIRTDTNETILPADHPGLTHGWNGIESDPSGLWRWTDGAAVIPWAQTGAAMVTVKCSAVDEYPIYDEQLRLVA